MATSPAASEMEHFNSYAAPVYLARTSHTQGENNMRTLLVLVMLAVSASYAQGQDPAMQVAQQQAIQQTQLNAQQAQQAAQQSMQQAQQAAQAFQQAQAQAAQTDGTVLPCCLA